MCFADSPSVQRRLWSDPATWSGGEVPGPDARISISENIHVKYDLSDSPRFDCVEVTGELLFSTSLDTSIYLNELMVMPSGILTVGTPANPVQSDVEAEIVFTDTPDDFGRHFKTGTVDDQGLDPNQYGNGLLVFGTATMHGTPLDNTFVRLSEDVDAGATELFFAEDVSAWQPGDTLALPDTRQINPVSLPDHYTYEPQWEEVQISAVEANRVVLAEPLEFAHQGALNADQTPAVTSDGIELRPHAANLDRNVVIRSENPDGVRGHTMFMGNANHDLRYVKLEELGRTRAESLDNTTFDDDGNLLHIGTNQVGRYSEHLHHIWGAAEGIDVATDELSYQTVSIGNSVVGALKWGTAIHDTHYGLFRDNVYYDSDGSAFATEDGNEFGNHIHSNFVLRVNGPTGPLNLENSEDDNGDQGDGFWFAGPMNSVRDNVASNVRGKGFEFFPNNVQERARNFKEVLVPEFPGADLRVADQSRLVNLHEVAVSDFQRNEVYGATREALLIWASGDTTNFPNAAANHIEDMRVWHVSNSGTVMYYAASFVIDGWTQRGDLSMIGQKTSEGGKSSQQFNAGIVHAGNVAANSLVRNADIQGLEQGYVNRGRGVSDSLVLEDSYLDNLQNILVWAWSQKPLDGSRDMEINRVQFGDATTPGSVNTATMVWNPPSGISVTSPETVRFQITTGMMG